MSILVLIPARRGSKGVPGKNTRKLKNKPLVAWSIETALRIFPKEQICVSSNDKEVTKIARSYGLNVPFERPESLCSDSASSRDVILHALNNFPKNGKDWESVLLLQPTSPFRRDNDILSIIELQKTEQLDAVVSVCQTKVNPYYSARILASNGKLLRLSELNVTRRQDAPNNVVELNGSVYLIDSNAIKSGHIRDMQNVKGYMMNEIYSIDIDTPFDWEVACHFAKLF